MKIIYQFLLLLLLSLCKSEKAIFYKMQLRKNIVLTQNKMVKIFYLSYKYIINCIIIVIIVFIIFYITYFKFYL